MVSRPKNLVSTNHRRFSGLKCRANLEAELARYLNSASVVRNAVIDPAPGAGSYQGSWVVERRTVQDIARVHTQIEGD